MSPDDLSSERSVGSTDEDARAAPRDSIFLGTEIARHGTVLRGRIRNISATGAYLELPEPLEQGETVVLRFRGIDRMEAEVVRLTESGAGVRFASEIDPAACRKSVLPEEPDWTRDYVLCLREGSRLPRWRNGEATGRRPPVRLS